MTLRLLTAACAAMCLVASSIAFANVAPPEPEQPAAAAPAAEGTAPPAEGAAPPAEGAAPAEAPAVDPAAAPVDPAAAPVEAAPEAVPAETPLETTAEAPAADMAPAEGGGTPWLWIVIGAAVAGGLGFFFWRRNAA
jgi:cytochrome c